MIVLVMGARRGGTRVDGRLPPSPGKSKIIIFARWRAFLLLFPHMGACFATLFSF